MRRTVIDFHTHSFPDSLSERAIPALEAEAPGVKAFLDGKVSSLLRSMDNAGIEQSVICSIATRPQQFDSILKWSNEIRSERITPFLSIHPADPDFREKIKRTAGEGFAGLKFHPFYQDFYLAEDRMLHLYEAIMEAGLMAVMHTGYDIAFPRIRRCDPRQILEVYERFPDIKLITTHLGAWEQWEEVKEMLIGREIYMEISFAYEFLKTGMRELLDAHPMEYILFGTDSPWTGQKETLDAIIGLGLEEKRLNALLYGNARRLLNL